MTKLSGLALSLIALGAIASPASALTLSSPDVPAGSAIAAKHVANVFGCSGGGVSPALTWKDPPKGTKSYVLTVYDPDAPTGSGFWHWVVANIPASAHGLPQGVKPNGAGLPAGAIQTRTDAGAKTGYVGPCPPAGDKPHRYVFTLYALKADKLDVNADSSGALVGFNVHFAQIDKASFTATFGR